MDLATTMTTQQQQQQQVDAQGAKIGVGYLAGLHPFPHDSRVRFFDIGHFYEIDGDTRFVTSMTTIISKYCNEFNADEILSDKYMEKISKQVKHENHGLTRQEIKDKWAANGKLQSELGTRMHFGIELFYNQLPVPEEIKSTTEFGYFLKFHNLLMTLHTYKPLVDNVLTSEQLKRLTPGSFLPNTGLQQQKQPYMHQFQPSNHQELLNLWNRYGKHELPEHIKIKPFRSEPIIIDPSYYGQIAGSVDMLYENALDPSILYMIDWKRSKSIEMYAKFKSQGKMHPPFNHFIDTNWGHYQLQQNGYKMLFEKILPQYKIEKMFLLICHPNNSTFQLIPIKADRFSIALLALEREKQVKEMRYIYSIVESLLPDNFPSVLTKLIWEYGAHKNIDWMHPDNVIPPSGQV